MGVRRYAIRHDEDTWDLVLLDHDPHSSIELPLATDRTLEIAFVDGDGNPTSVEGELQTAFRIPGAGVRRLRFITEPTASLELPALPAGAADVRFVPRGDAGALARTSATLDGRSRERIELRVDGAANSYFLVVNADGNPLAGASVIHAVAGQESERSNRSTTDALGRAAIFLADELALTVVPLHAGGSLSMPQSVPPRSTGEAVYLALEGTRDLELQVLSAGEPVSGGRLELFSGDYPRPVDWASTDSRGEYHRGGLAPGTYRLRARASGCFPATVTIQVPGDRATLDLIPTGRLRIEAASTDTTSAAGAPVEVVAVDGSGTLSEWMQSGHITGPAPILDMNGALTLEGLPVGEFQVAVEGIGTTTVRVAAGGTANVQL